MAIFNTVYGGEPKWKPWSNTLAYYPLETDTNDYSGNSNNLTNNWIIFSTYDNVKCWYFNKSAYAQKSWSLFTWNPTFTVSEWIKTNGSSNWQNTWFIGETWSNNSFSIWLYWNTRQVYVWGWSNDKATWKYIADSIWHNITFTYSGGSGIVYIDGVSVYTWTWSPNIISWYTMLWNNNDLWVDYLYWYLSQVIIEDKVRTADEVVKYYNSTKSTYGL